MPKVFLTQEDRINLQFRALIKKYQVLRGLKSEDMAEGLGISMPTYYRRMKDPSTLTLADVRSIQRRLKIPGAELLEALEN